MAYFGFKLNRYEAYVRLIPLQNHHSHLFAGWVLAMLWVFTVFRLLCMDIQRLVFIV
jgi:hypothetical protein